jgi:hypothetical protein
MKNTLETSVVFSGPKPCEIRVAIGSRDFTTTLAHYDFFLNTVAEKSLCFGPGLCEDQEAGVLTRLEKLHSKRVGKM